MTTIFELAAKLQAAGAAEGLLLIVAKATLILAIARLLLAVMPRASAATKHLVATAALVAVGVLPILSVSVPAWTIASTTLARTKAQPAIGVKDTDSSERPITLRSAISLAKATGVVPAEPFSAVERATAVARATWKGMLVLLAGFVALLLLAQMTAGIVGVWYVARRAEELQHDDALLELDHARDALALGVDVRLLRSSRISVPVLWGVSKPVLLLPPDVVTWPADRLRVVLLHELAHLKRFDGISLLLTRVAVSLFWFHPLAWSLERAGRRECERACDDLVLAGGTKPSEYADHLLAIARSMPSFDPFRSVTLAMSRKSQLEGRLLSILQPHVVRRVFTGRRVAIACALAVAVIVPISALRLIAEPSKREAKPSGSTVTVTPQVESLQDYFVAKLGKYSKSADRFATTPDTGDEWYERAYDFYHADRYPEAGAAFRMAASKGHDPGTSLYNAACSFALAGDADRAIEAASAAIDAGWDDLDKFAEDSDFDAIRADPRFAKAVHDTSGDVATRRFTETARRYQELQAEGATEDSGKEWYNVGLDLLRLRRYDDSIHAFEQSIAARNNVGSSLYNIACAQSLRGDVRGGLVTLDKAIENGFSDDGKLESDPDIAQLRGDAAFGGLARKASDLELRGCCGNATDIWNILAMKDWGEAVAHHRAMTQKYPASGRAWSNLGYAALQDRNFPVALDAYHKALDLGYRRGTASYNIACAYAIQGNRDAAFDWLERARAADFNLEDYVDHDDDLDSLHRDPRWDALLATLDVREKNHLRTSDHEKMKHDEKMKKHVEVR
jgi:beta-lactamase regulating signal transducer with metallopeptidase domain